MSSVGNIPSTSTNLSLITSDKSGGQSDCWLEDGVSEGNILRPEPQPSTTDNIYDISTVENLVLPPALVQSGSP